MDSKPQYIHHSIALLHFVSVFYKASLPITNDQSPTSTRHTASRQGRVERNYGPANVSVCIHISVQTADGGFSHTADMLSCSPPKSQPCVSGRDSAESHLLDKWAIMRVHGEQENCKKKRPKKILKSTDNGCSGLLVSAQLFVYYNFTLFCSWLSNEQQHKQDWPKDRLYHILCTLPATDNRSLCR